MVDFDFFDLETKRFIKKLWVRMSDDDKKHFINQVSLALSIWGSDEKGRLFVLDVLKAMIRSKSLNLADFGLYLDELKKHPFSLDRLKQIKRAQLILDGYRIENNLPPVSEREWF